MFERWGRFVYRRRWALLVLSGLLLAGSVAGVLRGGDLTSGNSGAKSLEAVRANDLVNAQLAPAPQQQAGSSFLLIYGSPTLSVADPAFRSALEAALAKLQADPRVSGLITPYSVPPAAAAGFISRDSHEALVRVQLKDPSVKAQKYYQQLRDEAGSDTLSVKATGNVALNRAFNTTLEADLNRAERISLPVTLLLLILIFGTLVAAGLPVGVGLLAILGGLAGTFFLSHLTDVSQYALNIVTLIGLAVAIDYSLFVVNRFRDELSAGRSREDAIATAVATAGRSIAFSGLTVAIGLSAMLFFQGTFMASMGAAGTIVVAIAVFYGLTFLPALLSVVGDGVNRLRMPFVAAHRHDSRGFWHAMARWVMRRPLVVLLPALAFLLLAGVPFLQIRLANGDVDQLPPGNEARQGYDTLVRDFPGQDQTVVAVVAYYPGGSPATPQHQADLKELTTRLAALPDVLRVEPGGIGANVELLDVVTNKPPTSDPARAIVRSARGMALADGGQVLVTGQSAFDIDTIAFIEKRVPMAVGAVLLVTYLVLFLLTGSLVLPLKAVAVNLLSISASFGALVWIFQEGHLSGLLNFTAQSLDPSVPVILFSIVFGMSMDYEVFLVSRIQEEYQRSGDNREAVALGLQRSGRLITGAAAIMVAVFVSFGLAEVVIIKAIGIGLAIAVAIDATIVRMLLVPSVMRLLGNLNWWAPRPLAWLHRTAGAGEPLAEATSGLR